MVCARLVGRVRTRSLNVVSINKKVDKVDPSCFQYHLMIMEKREETESSDANTLND